MDGIMITPCFIYLNCFTMASNTICEKPPFFCQVMSLAFGRFYASSYTQQANTSNRLKLGYASNTGEDVTTVRAVPARLRNAARYSLSPCRLPVRVPICRLCVLRPWYVQTKNGHNTHVGTCLALTSPVHLCIRCINTTTTDLEKSTGHGPFTCIM